MTRDVLDAKLSELLRTLYDCNRLQALWLTLKALFACFPDTDPREIARLICAVAPYMADRARPGAAREPRPQDSYGDAGSARRAHKRRRKPKEAAAD